MDRDKLIDIYRRANLIFLTDERLRRMILGGELQAMYYSPRGQEVVSAAMMAAIETSDYLVTTYRGIHDQLAKGIPLELLFGEYTGRATGACKGKGGPMHITHPASGVMVTTGIVGSGLPIANGLALANQFDGKNAVTVCCFGDGATNIGAFHEALNMASIWKLPVIFLCQNNLYSECSPFAFATSAERLVDRGPAYGIKAVEVNGNDADAMYAVAVEAVARARNGDGPTFIDARTFRFMGHYLGDNSSYIPAEEMAAAKLVDPIPQYRQTLIERQIPEADLDAIDAELTVAIDAAMAKALVDPFPDVAESRRDIFEVEIRA
jgi:TPP-dependent pyruvate/acetoin dehydrogenase alpha subunit